MKQLAKLAQAIVHGPKLIILDEPTNGLDPPTRQRMIRLIREIRDSGQAHILLSSHLLRDVEECCEEILILKDGRIAAYCNLEEERKANRKFLEMETRGDTRAFAEAIGRLGCEYALAGERRIKLVLQDGVEIRDLYKLAAERAGADPPPQLQARLARRHLPQGDGGPTMAVYEHTYKPYAGPLTPRWSRFLVIPRHAYREHLSVEALHRASSRLLHLPAGRGDPDLPAPQR